jgi:uncharacterized protein DUF1566
MKSIRNLLLALLAALGLSATAVQANSGTSPSCASKFPATGQTNSYPAYTETGHIAVQDDGVVRAGGKLSYTGTGPTIIDNNTKLEWEVLGQPDMINVAGVGGIHDWRTLYWWSCPNVGGVTSECGPYMSIWDKVVLMNHEGGGGYAGHSDWRVPNIKELMSIVDYEAGNPAVDSIFNTGSLSLCDPDSTDCSFTDGNGQTGRPQYWSSTTMSKAGPNGNGGPTHAWYVSFGQGAVQPDQKDDNTYHVRLVRGGCLPTPTPTPGG